MKRFNMSVNSFVFRPVNGTDVIEIIGIDCFSTKVICHIATLLAYIISTVL